MMSSPQWNPPRSNGTGVGACTAMHTVLGRQSCLAKSVNDAFVSPRPWSNMSTFTASCEFGGGVMDNVILGGKSEAIRKRSGMMAV